MPQRPSGKKELRKNRVRKMRNLDIKTDLRKTVKKYLIAVVKKDAKQAAELLKVVYKKIDKAAKSNIFHKNTAARRKSRYGRLLTKTS